MATAVTKREELLQEAIKIVTRDRNATHGEPEDNFKNIGKYWSTYMTATYGALIEFTPHDIAVLMALVKIARISTSPGVADHWIDLAGYAACGGGIAVKPEV